MKRPLLLLLPAIFLGTACERHSASSLPSHGGHSEEHAPASVGTHAEKPHAPEAPSPAKDAPAKDAPAAKFFDQQPK